MAPLLTLGCSASNVTRPPRQTESSLLRSARPVHVIRPARLAASSQPRFMDAPVLSPSGGGMYYIAAERQLRFISAPALSPAPRTCDTPTLRPACIAASSRLRFITAPLLSPAAGAYDAVRQASPLHRCSAPSLLLSRAQRPAHLMRPPSACLTALLRNVGEYSCSAAM